MALRGKGRRRIAVGGRDYLWWVKIEDEDDFVGAPMVTVVSERRELYVKYGLVQPDDRRYLISSGSYCRGIDEQGSTWRCFRCPKFGTEETIAPKGVEALIRWCLQVEGETVEVDWRGAKTAVRRNGVAPPMPATGCGGDKPPRMISRRRTAQVHVPASSSVRIASKNRK